MSKAKTSLSHKQLRLTFQYKHWEDDDETGERTYPEPPLAFAIAYDPTHKSWSTDKHRVQDQWAYSTCRTWRYERENFIVAVESKWGKDPVTGKYRTVTLPEAPLLPELQPRILENLPCTGFRIAKSVSRWSTSNKLWRIIDPRGFMLEISTQNMEDILMTGTVNAGWIEGEFIWVPGRTVKLERA